MELLCCCYLASVASENCMLSIRGNLLEISSCSFKKYVKHERPCLATFPNIEKRVEIGRVAEYSRPTSKCLVMWSNIVLSV